MLKRPCFGHLGMQDAPGPHFFLFPHAYRCPGVPAVVIKVGELVSQILNLLCAHVFDIVVKLS